MVLNGLPIQCQTLTISLPIPYFFLGMIDFNEAMLCMSSQALNV